MVPKETEIVIVGAGVIGSSIAYFLSEARKDVVVLERGQLVAEASAANGAFVWASTRRPGIDLDLPLASIEIHRQLQGELDIDTEYRRRGGLIVIENERQIPALEAFRKEKEKVGVDLKFLEIKETRALEPVLSERMAGALYNPLDGGANPLYLVTGLQKRAEQNGGRIFHHTGVRDIQLEGDKVMGVITDQATVRTDLVVNACGARASFIGKMVVVEIPIIPNEMEFVVTERLPPVVSHIIMGASYVTEEYSKEEMIRDREKFGRGLCIHQTVSGSMLLGATWRFVGYDKRTNYEETVAIATEVVNIYPSLKDVHVIRSFANFFPFTADDLPILGTVDGVDGLVMAAGHCGHTVCLGPITAKLIAELICEDRTSLPIDELSLSRFSDRACGGSNPPLKSS